MGAQGPCMHSESDPEYDERFARAVSNSISDSPADMENQHQIQQYQGGQQGQQRQGRTWDSAVQQYQGEQYGGQQYEYHAGTTSIVPHQPQQASGPTGVPLPSGFAEDPHTTTSRVRLAEGLKLPVRGGPNEPTPSWECLIHSQFRLLRKVGVAEKWQAGVYFVANGCLAACHNQNPENPFQSVINQVTLDNEFSIDGGSHRIPIPLKNVEFYAAGRPEMFQLRVSKDSSLGILRDYTFDMVAANEEERDRFRHELATTKTTTLAQNELPSGSGDDRSCGGDGCIVC